MTEEAETGVYKVFINCMKAKVVNTEKEAWDFILSFPLGTLYAVYDENDEIRDEFIPF